MNHLEEAKKLVEHSENVQGSDWALLKTQQAAVHATIAIAQALEELLAIHKSNAEFQASVELYR